MNVAVCLASLLPEPSQAVQAEAPLNGDETLDHFVRLIRQREKCRAKRARFPDLAPCDMASNENHAPRWRRKVALFW